jgi:hypothetical protein
MKIAITIWALCLRWFHLKSLCFPVQFDGTVQIIQDLTQKFRLQSHIAPDIWQIGKNKFI